MKTELHIDTGEVKSASSNTVLKSDAIGSCVAVIALDIAKRAGAMAHIMLPGEYTKDVNPCRLRYAVNALRRLSIELESLGSSIQAANIFLVGGGNVLKEPNDTVAQNNINEIKRILTEKHATITAEAVGGTLRRTAMLDIERRCVFYSEGDGELKILWSTV